MKLILQLITWWCQHAWPVCFIVFNATTFLGSNLTILDCSLFLGALKSLLMGIAGWRIGGWKIIMSKWVCPPVLFTNLNVNVMWSVILMCTVQMVLHLAAGCSYSSCLSRAFLDASSVHPVFFFLAVIREYTVHALSSAFGQWFNHSPICHLYLYP
jgi:hypothetical protein